MRSDLIEKASKVIPDTPLLINVVSQRVRQLNQGRAPLVSTGGARVGLADVALMEIIEGKVAIDDPDEDDAKI
jgi:DNA-directed RNA polymerase subunit omega